MEEKEVGRTGVMVPVIGMGTWNLVPPDQYAPIRPDEKGIVNALKLGIELGMTFIDSAAMYGDSRAEQLVGQAIRGIRDKVFIATKVEPWDYSFKGVQAAAEKSLKRLGIDYIDLYQMHWPGMPVTETRETLRGMERLVDEGKVRVIGVSNFSKDELIEAQGFLSNHRIESNQVKYNLLDRDIETDLLEYAEQEQITVMAYSPFGTGALFDYTGRGREVIERLAQEYDKTFAQVCLNWVIARKQVITIPKAVRPEHVRENAAAADWHMAPESYEALSRAFGGYLSIV